MLFQRKEKEFKLEKVNLNDVKIKSLAQQIMISAKEDPLVEFYMNANFTLPYFI